MAKIKYGLFLLGVVGTLLVMGIISGAMVGFILADYFEYEALTSFSIGIMTVLGLVFSKFIVDHYKNSSGPKEK